MADLLKTNRLNALYDLYKGLLTEKQRIFFEHYYHDDYTLAEIAEILSISRNGVFDQLKKTENLLEHYEHILMLQAKKEARSALLEELRKTQNCDLIDSIEALD